MLKTIRAPGLTGEGSSEAEELRVLQEVSDWLEDGIGDASERLDLTALLRHTRDRAMLLLLFWRRLGVEELVNLRVEDMKITSLEGLTCNVIGPKGLRQVNWRRICVPALVHLCPVSAVQFWLSVSGLAGGPLFPRIKRSGDLGDDGMPAGSVLPMLLNLVALSHVNNGPTARESQ